jgi:two-component system chemotaxis response regulator CheY
MLSLRSE